ncbi:MAG: lipoprotein [Lachnospiraceae bacterium]|nr:lipoprotein [Lachnospiraceae bacterium]
MKKYWKILIILAIVAIFMLSGCSSDDGDDDNYNDKTEPEITQTVSNDSKPTATADTDSKEKNDTSDNAGKKEDVDNNGTDDGKKEDSNNTGKKEDADNDGTNNGTGDAASQTKSVTLSVNNSSGEMKVSRKAVGKKNNGLSEGWTLFVYLCGTDLESDYYAGTYDLDEMLSASTGKKVKFIVQTGGTSYWNNDLIKADKIQRYLISQGDITLLEEQKIKDMGSPDTLSEFIKWGLKNHASQHNGLILWNHGGGSITGVCFDERYDNDSLDLTELDEALGESLTEIGMKLDFIGFDACLMGTVETANILATYADYMYGSEELEPGSGWDYTAIGDYLGSKPDADAVALGKTVADSFLKSCERDNDDALATFSIIDLSKVDNILTKFNAFAQDLYEAGEDVSNRADIVRAIAAVDDFGGNNKTEGYTNMIDLGGLIKACSAYSKNADAAVKAISDAVVYSISGSMHKGASGLSTYYPISVQGSQELSFFGKVCVSPYYLSFVDRQGSIGASGDMYTEYDDDTWFDDDGDWFWGDWDYYDDDYWDYIDDYEETGESPYISFYVEPTFEDGMYYFMLDDEGMYNTADVYGMVYVMNDDGTEAIEYGETYDVDADWESGIFFDNFDGWWVSLPDGQNLATYIVDYTEDSITYTSPVLLNDRETNLRLRLTADKIVIEGAWDGIDDASGAASRDIVKLKKGDRIVPMYYSISLDDKYEYGDDESMYYGDEYVFDGEPEIYYDMMYPGEYLYAFCIDDIYGDYYLTEFETFYINDDGEVEF